jgi:hypothetical protein
MHHPRYTFTSFQAKLGNPSSTCFQVKQAARSWHVSHAVFILPLVLWHNRQTITHLVLRHKPRNRHSDFVGQITKPQLPVLRPKPGEPPTLLLRPNQETRSHRFWGQTRRNCQPWFWGWTKKPTLLVSLCMVQTAHSVSRPLDHPVTEYLTCTWSSPVLYTKSPTPNSILVTARHIAPVTCTPGDKQSRFSTQHK